MKMILTAAAFAAMTTTAYAEMTYSASGEVAYSLENEAFTMELGPDLVYNDFTVEARVYSSLADSEVNFDGVGLEIDYSITDNASVFGAVQANGDFEYEDAQVGVRFTF